MSKKLFKDLRIDTGCVEYNAHWYKKEKQCKENLPSGNKSYIEHAYRNGKNEIIEKMLDFLQKTNWHYLNTEGAVVLITDFVKNELQGNK